MFCWTLLGVASVIVCSPSALADEQDRVLEWHEPPAAEDDESVIGSLNPAPEDGDQKAGLFVDGDEAPQIRVNLNADGSRYLRFSAWLQVWIRAMQLNPGTTVRDQPTDWYGDIAIRRARLMMFGSIFPRVNLMMHFGMNNQSFVNGRKPQLFFHDLWVEFEIHQSFISMGAGLIYWNGVSRMTNASTITLLPLDVPTINWATIDETDQFARQLGLYAKGQAAGFDYRVAVTRPFSTEAVPGSGRPGELQPQRQHIRVLGLLPILVLGRRERSASLHGRNVPWHGRSSEHWRWLSRSPRSGGYFECRRCASSADLAGVRS